MATKNSVGGASSAAVAASLPSYTSKSTTWAPTSVRARASICVSTLVIRVLRRKTAVPTPAANRPMARSATVTPVTFARRLVPRHDRVIASVLCARAAPRVVPADYAGLPAFSM